VPIVIVARVRGNADKRGIRSVSIKRRTVTTIETHEVWVVRSPIVLPVLLCAQCADEGCGMLTPLEAARRAGVSQRTVYRWVDDGRIHFTEITDGGLFVCLAPLLI
jgi:excisionase family DNA binding protein